MLDGTEARRLAIRAAADVDQEAQGKGLLERRWCLIAVAGAVAFLLVFSRRPDALLNPQFYAEDGRYLYAQAYTLGPFPPLLIPVAGYLVTSARLVAALAVLFPLSWGPGIFNVFAIAMQVAPVLFLLSERFDRLIPNWWARGALVCLYLSLPNSAERDVGLIYSQWSLALLAFLIVIAASPMRRGWKLFDGLVFALAVLTGPFCIFLVPVVALRWLRTRDLWLLRLLAIAVAGSCAQGAVLFVNSASSRPHGPLGADGLELVRILAGQLVLGATAGMKGYEIISMSGWWATAWFPTLLMLLGGIFVVSALRHAPQELRLLWLYGALVFVAALFSPAGYFPLTHWQLLAYPTFGLRYEYFLIIAWMSTLVWVVSASTSRMLRRAALVFLAFACFIAVPLDWEYPAFADHHYQLYIQRFEQAPPGSQLVIPLNPTDWTMTLTKR